MTIGSRHDGVLTLLSDREAIARLQQALRPGPAGGAVVEVRRVARVAELRAALADRRWGVVVVEARDADLVPTDEAIREIRRAQPSAIVVGYVRRGELASPILDFARAGVHELVVGGIDDGGRALRSALASAAKRATADELFDDVAALVAPSLHPMVRHCLQHHGDAGSVPDVARALGISRQALVARARRAAAPSPRELLTWCRLLLAARLLAGGGQSVDDVAIALDFASPNGLRNAFHRYGTLTVQQVRRDGLAPVLAAFGAAVEAARAAAGTVRRERGDATTPADVDSPALA